MTNNSLQQLPTTARLLRATVVAMLVASALLITIVLPAEYAIDPTGVGRMLGLDALSSTSEPTLPTAVPNDATSPAPGQDREANAISNAAAAFGASENQSFATESVSPATGVIRQDELTVELAPGKGVEVKAKLQSGQGFTYQWKASDEVAVDMHGEREGAKNVWTSYDVETAQREASGTFIAPFDGTHGWYWLNRSTTPVVVTVSVSGFQSSLDRP